MPVDRHPLFCSADAAPPPTLQLLSKSLLVLLVLSALVPATLQFGFSFDDMFQQQQGGGRGGGEEKAEAEQIAPGYKCENSEYIVDHPRLCPCPGHKMIKCKLDDWYVCLPSGAKCPEGQFRAPAPQNDQLGEFDDEEE